MAPTQVAAAAPHTSATAWRLSAKARPRLMKIATNSPASTAAAVLRSRPGISVDHTAAGNANRGPNTDSGQHVIGAYCRRGDLGAARGGVGIGVFLDILRPRH